MEPKKSKKVTLLQIQAAYAEVVIAKEIFNQASDRLQKASTTYKALLKRASATVVKQHTLEK